MKSKTKRNNKGQFQKGNIEPNRNRFPKNNTLGVTHGLSKHPIYVVWTSMKNRCYHRPNSSYMKKGITVCEEWINDFKTFYEWALPRWKKGLQIDRIKNKQGYSPKNCRFITSKLNARNRDNTLMLTINNEFLSNYEASEKYGIVTPINIYKRIKIYNWNDYDAVFIPKGGKRHVKN